MVHASPQLDCDLITYLKILTTAQKSNQQCYLNFINGNLGVVRLQLDRIGQMRPKKLASFRPLSRFYGGRSPSAPPPLFLHPW